MNRRALLLTSACGVIYLSALGKARALTGIDAIDTPALIVKRPNDIFLVGITLAGSRLVAVGEHGVIVYSDDNGARWIQAKVPVDLTLTCVAFSTPMSGWAAGHFGVILNTIDAGKTWHIQLDGIRAAQLTLLAARDTNISNLSPAKTYAMKRANIFVEEGPNKPFLALLVMGPQKVIAFGAYRMSMMTSDGGKTWTDCSLSIFDELSHNLYAATMIGKYIYVVAETGLVFCSGDGGNSFPQVTSPGDVTLFGVIGARDGSIIVFGVAGSIFKTTDACKTWTQITVDSQDNLTAGMILRSGQILIASEVGTLFLSKDNGATFNKVSGVQPGSIFGVEQAPNTDLIFVGASGLSRLPAKILNA